MSDSESLREILAEEKVDYFGLLATLWAGKRILAISTAVFSVLAVAVALVLPNQYSASALIAPNEAQAAGGLSALADQYGGLASLAGIDLAGGGSDKSALGIEILKSRKFIGEFIKRHDILVPLMAAKRWDPSSGELIVDSNDYDSTAKQWVRKVRPPWKAIPSSQEAYEEFMERMQISQDKKTGFVTLSFVHYSPEIAKRWVDQLVADLNAFVMMQDVSEAQSAIDFLNEQIASTTVADLRSVFFNLIEEQTKTVMLAKVTDEYLFKTIDPAVAPEKKLKPKRARIAVSGFLLGLVFGAGLVFVLSMANTRKVSAGTSGQ